MSKSRIAMIDGYDLGAHLGAARLDEVRAFTGEEVAWMEATIKQVTEIVFQRQRELAQLQMNPLNYLTEPNRDAMTRLENLVKADFNHAKQLRDSKNSVIESGDTDKYERWMALAATINDSGAARVFREQANYSSIAETVKAVGKNTYNDLMDPSNWPWWVWVAGGVAAYLIIEPRLSRRG